MKPRGGVAALAAAALAAWGCLSEHVPGEPASGMTCARAEEPPGPDSVIVVVRGFQYLPADLAVAPGTRVVWINCEPAGTPGHTTTADGGLWDSPTLAPGDVFSLEAPSAGSFGYHCRPHPGIRGTLAVSE